MSGCASTYGEVVLTVLRREYAPYRHAAKLLARDANATPRAAEGWLAGTHAPNGEKLVHLLASCEALADELNRLVAERRAARRP